MPLCGLVNHLRSAHRPLSGGDGHGNAVGFGFRRQVDHREHFFALRHDGIGKLLARDFAARQLVDGALLVMMHFDEYVRNPVRLRVRHCFRHGQRVHEFNIQMIVVTDANDIAVFCGMAENFSKFWEGSGGCALRRR